MKVGTPQGRPQVKTSQPKGKLGNSAAQSKGAALAPGVMANGDGIDAKGMSVVQSLTPAASQTLQAAVASGTNPFMHLANTMNAGDAKHPGLALALALGTDASPDEAFMGKLGDLESSAASMKDGKLGTKLSLLGATAKIREGMMLNLSDGAGMHKGKCGVGGDVIEHMSESLVEKSIGLNKELAVSEAKILANTKATLFAQKAHFPMGMDINAFVQAVLRESYLLQNEMLRDYADKVKFYNEQKKATRNKLEWARAQALKYEEGDALPPDVAAEMTYLTEGDWTRFGLDDGDGNSGGGPSLDTGVGAMNSSDAVNVLNNLKYDELPDEIKALVDVMTSTPAAGVDPQTRDQIAALSAPMLRLENMESWIQLASSITNGDRPEMGFAGLRGGLAGAFLADVLPKYQQQHAAASQEVRDMRDTILANVDQMEAPELYDIIRTVSTLAPEMLGEINDSLSDSQLIKLSDYAASQETTGTHASGASTPHPPDGMIREQYRIDGVDFPFQLDANTETQKQAGLELFFDIAGEKLTAAHSSIADLLLPLKIEGIGADVLAALDKTDPDAIDRLTRSVSNMEAGRFLRVIRAIADMPNGENLARVLFSFGDAEKVFAENHNPESRIVKLAERLGVGQPSPEGAVGQGEGQWTPDTAGNTHSDPMSTTNAGQTADAKAQFDEYIKTLESSLSTIGDDAQLANVDLQNALQKQQQIMQMMSNISKMLHDTAMSIIRKIGG